jgi:hypothetical protein
MFEFFSKPMAQNKITSILLTHQSFIGIMSSSNEHVTLQATPLVCNDFKSLSFPEVATAVH